LSIDVIEEVGLFILTLIIALWIAWQRIFAYSPDENYCLNRFNGVLEEATLAKASYQADGSFIAWNSLGVVRGKERLQEMWGQGSNVDVDIISSRRRRITCGGLMIRTRIWQNRM